MTVKMKVTVVFDLWGQRCETKFDEDSELDYMTWIRTVVEKGYMYPIEAYFEENGVVIFTEADAKEIVDQRD